jgi:DNA polymerase-3 subunit delta
MVLRENRLWGTKERLFTQLLPRISLQKIQALLHSAHICDGIIKGITHPDWPTDPWHALRYWVATLLTTMK